MPTNSAIAVLEPKPESIVPVTPMEMLQMAVSQGADLDKLSKLMELQERWEANEARKAFNLAMAAFKTNPPEIKKNKHVLHNDFWHATLDEVVAKITPALSAVGIRHRWDIDQTKAPQITVTCILSHEMGHSESTPLSATADTSGSKNAIQSIGSAVTYLQRYTLLAATGMAAANTDNDAQNTGAVPQGVVQEWLLAISEAADADSLKRFFTDAYKKAQIANDRKAMQAYMDAKEKRKVELQ